jgi:hypothetical protein
LAIKALTNSLDKDKDPTLTDIFNTVDLINNAFDQGRYAINIPVVNTAEIKTISRTLDGTSDVIQVIQAYPNPFSGTLNFTLSPRSSGQATLELYNMAGQKVATIFDGELKVGEEQNVQYTMPSGQTSQTLIFHFRQGTEVVQGKLISL